MPTQRIASPFHLMAKPAGAACNLACRYCFYLAKKDLYPTKRLRMSDRVLETYTRQLVESRASNELTISWQGGEPLLMGLDFFRRAVEYQRRFTKQGLVIHNALQTNGILLNDAWCRFFRRHEFLIGLSLDGPQEYHDTFRRDRAGNPTFKHVMTGLRCLQKRGVDFNILATVHAANADHPLEVYRFFRDEVAAGFLQFIPIVERETDASGKATVTGRSVKGGSYGRFLSTIFDEWVRRDVGRVFVQTFDVSLERWIGAPPTLCIFSPTCGTAPVMEHNGDVYVCDHFVEPLYLLGNIMDTDMASLMASDRIRRFGANKEAMLPGYCRSCDVRFACHGECPKNRILPTPDGEPGLNYLCRGYRDFFHHIDQPMCIMADLLRRGEAPARIMSILKAVDLETACSRAKRNDPCPCGSGKKFKHCHGRI